MKDDIEECEKIHTRKCLILRYEENYPQKFTKLTISNAMEQIEYVSKIGIYHQDLKKLFKLACIIF